MVNSIIDALGRREAIRQLATEYARLIDAKDLRAVAEHDPDRATAEHEVGDCG